MLRFCGILFAALFTGCGSGSGPPVDIVVPKGFTGPVWIMLDPDGQDIPLVDGRYQVIIPKDGVLRVKSFHPFERWHQSSSKYDDGTLLPEEPGGNPAGPDTVALRGGGSAITQRDGKDVHWMPYFVGTAKQYHERPPLVPFQDPRGDPKIRR
jgi:hypothetical protein